MINNTQKYQIKQFLIIKLKKKFRYKKILLENYLEITEEFAKWRIHKLNGLTTFILLNKKNMI